VGRQRTPITTWLCKIENDFYTTQMYNFYTTQNTLVRPMYGGTHMHESHQCVLGCVKVVHLDYATNSSHIKSRKMLFALQEYNRGTILPHINVGPSVHCRH
jgi:hypothetical protein